MAATAAKLMSVRAAVLEVMVVVLERAKHGTLARAVKARAEHLAIVAQGIEGKVEYVSPPINSSDIRGSFCDVVLTDRRVAKLEIAAALYTPETLAALERYRVHLRDTRAQLEERRGVAVEELKRYGDVTGSERGTERGGYGDAGALAEIASRYGELVREVENVRMEIARLGE
jgi:diphthamide biosynthesis protein 3